MMKTAVPTTDPVCELIRAPFAPYFRAQFPVLGLSSEGFVWWETVQNHWGRCLSTCNSCNLSEQVGVASKARE